ACNWVCGFLVILRSHADGDSPRGFHCKWSLAALLAVVGDSHCATWSRSIPICGPKRGITRFTFRLVGKFIFTSDYPAVFLDFLVAWAGMGILQASLRSVDVGFSALSYRPTQRIHHDLV